jgi:hypothetical protein
VRQRVTFFVQTALYDVHSPKLLRPLQEWLVASQVLMVVMHGTLASMQAFWLLMEQIARPTDGALQHLPSVPR